MEPLILRDNSLTPCATDEYIEELRYLSEHTLQELIKSEELLAFPYSFSQLHGIDDKELSLFHLRNGGREIATGNLMGFIGYNNLRISILSRFAPSGKADSFLQYMLMKTGGVNIFQLEHTGAIDQTFNLMIFLFPMILKKAMVQGLFKEYCNRQYNDPDIKGRIDVSRHIRKNIPFSGAIAYNSREYSYDNRITQLIRHTVEYIKCSAYSAILENDADTKEYVSQIVRATPNYDLRMRSSIINKNIQPVNHPYFCNYMDLQKLCLQILRNEQFKYGVHSNKVHGILFDGAWLWEEYVNTILSGCGFIHPKNKEKSGWKNLLTSDSQHKWRCYPDFYREASEKIPAIVLDAKYKRMRRGSSNTRDEESDDEKRFIQREDRYQIISYIHLFKAAVGGFIIPVSEMQGNTCCHSVGTLRGYGGTVLLFDLAIPSCADNFRNFSDAMQLEENHFKAGIEQYFRGIITKK
ncbi:McrC family protein [Brucepastera parasyntrophica]|uniref:McrC family protein n=1 Tax=Brucepastera parasyntrophica TaxID=2880008 RepID=UPI00210D9C4A|nr:McrC family protein [Brucepastera parasyntrophica]ULQ60423.1 McrC family protein [Brucepastera parasyntrophica]